jgi:hypothetical protein
MAAYTTPRDIAVALQRNWNGNRIPWVAGQCFGLTINEHQSEVCRLGPTGTAAGGDLALSPSAAPLSTETSHG